MEPDAIVTLINSVLYPLAPIQNAAKPVNDVPEKGQWSAEAPVFVPKENFVKRSTRPAVSKQWRNTSVPPTPPSFSQEQNDSDIYDEDADGNEEQEQYENNYDDRSVVLRGISPFTTLADIAKAVRGGIVLNMFLRHREKSAYVAFVEPLVAEKFVMHCRRNDMYIKGKRIEVYWDDKQHYMQAHTARRIHNNGATRNLVVRFPPPDTTPESIKEDLEHIDRLEIVSCEMKNGHAFISTNGVHHAVTAKTCMQSRRKYKHGRIDFYADECDQPLPDIVKKPYNKREHSPSKRKSNTISHMNRFALLNDADDEEFEDAHRAAVRRNVSANDAVWETKIAEVPVA